MRPSASRPRRSPSEPLPWAELRPCSTRRHRYPARRRGIALATAIGLLPACAGGPGRDDGGGRGVTLTVALRGWSSLRTYPVIKEPLARFSAATGIEVKYVPGLQDKPARLEQYLAWLEEGARTPDVYEADITEIGRLAEHMIDLRPYVGADIDAHIPALVDNYTIGGRLVGVPLYTDVGLLFYRSDLLEAYGYERPPRSWRELRAMATAIQAGERARGNREFWGFAWPGAEGDDLICFFLEVQASYGGGQTIEPDRTVSVRNPRAAAALRDVRGWVGSISPPGVTAYGQDDARNLWLGGNAAFHRNWPHIWSVSQAEGSLIRGKVGATALPSGGAGHYGTLGGWQLSVSKHSAHPREAAELIRYFTSRREQVRRAVVLSGLPTILDLYDDREVLEANPFFGEVKEVLQRGTVRRPSGTGRPGYGPIAKAYGAAVHSVLTGRAEADEALAALETELTRLTGYGVGVPGVPEPEP